MSSMDGEPSFMDDIHGWRWQIKCMDIASVYLMKDFQYSNKSHFTNNFLGDGGCCQNKVWLHYVFFLFFVNKFLHRNILFQIAHPFTDKLVVAPVWPNSHNSSKNCSVDEQAQVVQNLGGKGIILQSSNFNSNFSSTNYTGDDTIVVSLYKKDDNQACSDL